MHTSQNSTETYLHSRICFTGLLSALKTKCKKTIRNVFLKGVADVSLDYASLLPV